MEDIIMYVVIAGSVIWSIIKNFQDQKKKDANRTVGKPTAPQSSEPAQTPPPAPFSRPSRSRTQNQTTPTTPANTSNTTTATRTLSNTPTTIPQRSAVDAAIERANRQSLEQYTTLESTIPITGLSDEERKAFQEMGDLENIVSIEDEGDKSYYNEKIHRLFETKDDLKKAILYTAVLERKY